MDWEHSGKREWTASKDGFAYKINQDENTYEYTLSISYKDEELTNVVTYKKDFKTKAKAIKAAEKWKPEDKDEGTLFDKKSEECPKCGEECECDVEEEDNVKITITKTKRKEKLPDNGEPGKNDLKLALWYIEKIGGTKRAKKVFYAACKAMDEIK